MDEKSRCDSDLPNLEIKEQAVPLISSATPNQPY